ncbi:MAG TPA: hypothetical protein VHV55_11345, partial [Pirellulales bacterium]|nr:hypothetical protein [Pirellulales bacterium]
WEQVDGDEFFQIGIFVGHLRPRKMRMKGSEMGGAVARTRGLAQSKKKSPTQAMVEIDQLATGSF